MTHDTKVLITEIKFLPIHKNGSHIGFVSFLYNNQFSFKQVAVHQRNYPKDGLKYFLRYPLDRLCFPIYHPVNRVTQHGIEKTINDFLEETQRLREEQQ